jgi:hypothetical protein
MVSKKGGADVNSKTMMATHLYTVHAMRVTLRSPWLS